VYCGQKKGTQNQKPLRGKKGEGGKKNNFLRKWVGEKKEENRLTMRTMVNVGEVKRFERGRNRMDHKHSPGVPYQ